MIRYVWTLGFCCMLLWVSTACAPLPPKPEALSEHGYRVSLHVSDTLVFLGSSGLSVPQVSAVVVHVRNAQGQPVDGLLIVFSAEPAWTQNVSFPLREARTCTGAGRTIFEASTTGVVCIMARVDNVTRGARITIQSRPSPVGGSA